MANKKHLSPTWFMSNPVDLEHKQYILMDYLQSVQNNFNKTKLFPYIMDLKYHYTSLESFLTKREIIVNRLSKIKGIDLERMELVYEYPEDNENLQEIVDIATWSMPIIEKTFKEGRFLYMYVEECINLSYIGIIPDNYHKEGFLFIRQTNEIIVDVYEYKVKAIMDANGNKITIKKIDSFDFLSKDNYEIVKMKIAAKSGNNDNPIFICVETIENIPLKETLLPILQSMIMEKLEKDYVIERVIKQ